MLRGDTLAVVRQVGQRTRAETWLIKGDSAHMIDWSGRVLTSVPKIMVLATREIAQAKQLLLRCNTGRGFDKLASLNGDSRAH